MAKLVDPDDLNQATEITFTPGASGTIQLSVAGNLSTDGVTLQCIYSFCKEEWKSDSTLIKYAFPLEAITEEQFELKNDWNWADQTTKDLVRDGGWAHKNVRGDSREEYMCVSTLGSFDDENADKAYSLQVSGGTPQDIVLTGPVNQAVKIYGHGGYGNIDYRGYYKIFLREEQKTFSNYDLLTEQNLSTLTYKKYAMPLSNISDIKVTNDDSVVSAGASYVNIDATYYSAPQSRSIGGTSYNFDIIIEGDSKLAELIYEKVQYLLRQPTDIDEGAASRRGDIQNELLSFVGNTLVTTQGVYIDNIAVADTNRIDFYDTSNTLRQFPYVATGSLLFNENAVNDADAKYWMFFTSIGASAYGTDGAILVKDNDGFPITGDADSASIDFTFDYDGNQQGGRTGGEDAPITVVAIGLETAQFVKTTATLVSSKTNNVSITATLERNYDNP